MPMPPLLERGQHGSVGLAFPLLEADPHAFLLNQDAGGGQIAVNLFRGSRSITVIDLYPSFKFDDRCRLLNAVYILKQGQPKSLCLLFLIVMVLPVCCKLGGGTASFGIRHNSAFRTILIIPQTNGYGQGKNGGTAQLLRNIREVFIAADKLKAYKRPGYPVLADSLGLPFFLLFFCLSLFSA